MDSSEGVLDPAFGHWLAGFVDGEGCFTLNGTHRHVHPGFHLGLRADDREIIETIQAMLGFGRIYEQAARWGRSHGGHAQVVWALRSKADCLAFVAVLDRFPLRAKKRRDYLVWRAAVLVWGASRYCREHGRLIELREELAAVRAFT